MAKEVSLNRFSFLTQAKLRETKDGAVFWELTEFPKILQETQEDDVLLRLKSPERLDNLAYRFYGSPQLWWVIAFANRFRLPSLSLKPGMVVRIPSFRFLEEKVFVEVS